jgi:antitoxin MazE
LAIRANCPPPASSWLVEQLRPVDRLDRVPLLDDLAATRRIDSLPVMYILVYTLWRATMTKTATQTLQQWGNSLAVRIPASIARSVRFAVGQPVEVAVHDSTVVVTAVGRPKLTLAQRLTAFDPDLHGGEAMSTGRVGKEVF